MYIFFLKHLLITAILNIRHVSFIPPSGIVTFVNDRIQSGSRNDAMVSETRNLLMPYVPHCQEADHSQSDHAERQAQTNPNFSGGLKARRCS